MSQGSESPAQEVEYARPDEAALRQSAAYRRQRLPVMALFLVGVVICAFGFRPLGQALGALGASVYDAMVAGGVAQMSAGLAILLVADGVGFLLVLLLSLFGGPRVPSGFPHIVLGILIPLTLAVMQAEMFTRTGGAGGLADTEFARWSFVVMFLVTIATAEGGVAMGRHRLERRAG